MSRRAIKPDEAQLFLDTVADAKPLKKSKRESAPLAKPLQRPLSLPSPAHEKGSRAERAGGSLPPPKPLPPPGALAGIDKRTHQRFKKGEMEIDAKLDLHGMTQDAAHSALLRFVERQAAASSRCLLIVTGKGGREGQGVLRAQVPRWLNEARLRPLLLAVHQARQHHGGDGALYVLLKRKR